MIVSGSCGEVKMGFFEGFEKRAVFGLSSRGHSLDYHSFGSDDHLQETISGHWEGTHNRKTFEDFPFHKGQFSEEGEFFNPYTRKLKITSEAPGVYQKHRDRVGTNIRMSLHMDVPHGVDPRRIDQKKVFETIRDHPTFGSNDFWNTHHREGLSKEYQEQLNELEGKVRDIMHNHPAENAYKIPFTRPSRRIAEESRARFSARADALRKLKYRRIAGKAALGVGAISALGGAGYLLNRHFNSGFQKKSEENGLVFIW
jgi:hypothetical protein